MSRKLIFFSPFNTANFTHKTKYFEWNRRRFDFWKSHTMLSILRQRNPNWEYWLACNANLLNITNSFKSEISDPRIKILSYLQEFKNEIAKIPPCDHVLYARIDSDDLYAPDVADILLTAPIKAKYFQFNAGYAYCTYNKKLFQWHQNSSPFYTAVTTYGSGWPGIPSHAKIWGRSNVLASGKFCVLIHGNNTSTTLNAGPIKKEIRGDHEKKGILNVFGISTTA